MKKRYLLIPAAVVCVLTVTISLVYASSINSNTALGSPTDQIHAEPNQYIASFDTVKIDTADFLFYKTNAQRAAELNNAEMPSDQHLINNMLKDKITAYEAVQQGITVSDEEVQQEIDFQRDVFENQMEQTSPEAQEVYDMMKNRIRITGLSEEEFWDADFVKQVYKEALLEGKLMNALRGDDKSFETIEDFQKYKEELLSKYKDKISFNLE
ncbi:hypothetical protein [Paenibacillus lemnae]|uniref:Peptidylprolyl isomerase n=1 Tax=Paenibacillus lemnae TaxID=1330551 RepID=A0A848MDE4_PAELE|nr:hypothetical protein [Paenibacillus lemnae]NMO98062.1 hypothetical protein [Paenibacillus lemnae]